MRRTLVTIVSSGVSNNAVGRAHILAEMLSRSYDVEIVGMTWRGPVWAPLRHSGLRIETVRGHLLPLFALSAAQLMGKLRGDVVYAVKPQFASYGVALARRSMTGTPVILDIDDDELSFSPAPPLSDPKRIVASWIDPANRAFVRACLHRVKKADAITVASRALQQRHGGTLILHARDLGQLDGGAGSTGLRERLSVPAGRRIVMFAGTPRPHKGIEDAARAVERMRHGAVLVIVGADDADPYVRSLRAAHPDMVMLPAVAFDERGTVLRAADALVVPQRRTPQALLQFPAKLLDAMAVGVPVVATAVSDIPEVLGDDRGLVVEPDDPEALARALDSIFDRPDEAAVRASRARQWCAEHASYDAVAPLLAEVVARVTRRG